MSWRPQQITINYFCPLHSIANERYIYTHDPRLCLCNFFINFGDFVILRVLQKSCFVVLVFSCFVGALFVYSFEWLFPFAITCILCYILVLLGFLILGFYLLWSLCSTCRAPVSVCPPVFIFMYIFCPLSSLHVLVAVWVMFPVLLW